MKRCPQCDKEEGPFRRNGLCDGCYLERRRAHKRERYRVQREDPEWYEQKLARGREWRRRARQDPARLDVMRAQRREYQRRMKERPGWWESRLADNRMWYRLRSEREGKRQHASSRPVANVETRLDPRPLRALVEQFYANGGTPEVLAGRMGVDEAAVRRVFGGQHITLDKADRVCMALDTSLAVVYPDE